MSNQDDFLAPSGAQEMLIFVRSSGTSLSRALNLHLSLSGQSQVSLRSFPGHCQVSLRFPLGLSELTSSVSRSLKYFVLFSRKEILVNVIQCLQILLEESSAALDLTLVNTVARIKELNPDKDTDHLFLWEFRDNIQAIWETRAVQVLVT